MKSITTKQLFLADASGAVLTAICIGWIFVQNDFPVGLPQQLLIYLCGIAILFSIYSFCCFLWATKNKATLLKIIIAANICYTFITLFSLLYFYKELQFPGTVYFILEIVVIASLVFVEIKHLRNISN